MTEGESQRCPGMRDLLPDDMERFRRAERTFIDVCREWGFREVRTPTIEYLHLFTSAGTLSPQTLDRVYSFLDWDGWSGERVVLRPDATIPAARLYAKALDGGKLARLCYVQNVFRFTTGGEEREEWQAGVELIGDTAPAGDVELALLAAEVLRRLGIEGFALKVSHAGIVRALLARTGLRRDEQVALYQRLLDEDTGVVTELERLLPDLDAPLRLLFDIEGGGSAYLSNVRGALSASIPELETPFAELATLVAALEACGLRPAVQAALARRFEYYSGPVFRFEADGRRLGGGGRYDHLVELVQGKAIPASGFAFEMASLMALLRPEGAEAAPAVVVEPDGVTPEALAAAFRAAAGLRALGQPCLVGSGGDAAAVRLRPTGNGFTLTADGAKPRTFSSLSDVVAALGGAQ